jgi:hypothetical protein
MIEFEFGLAWQSDFAGDEVGYPEIDIVGIYNLEAGDGYTYTFLINMDDERILEIYKDDEE